MGRKHKAIAVLLLAAMVFSWFGAVPEVANAASDPRDINPPLGAEVTIGNTSFFSTGFWSIYVDGRRVGEALALAEDYWRGSFGDTKNMLHQSTLSSWANSFTPTPTATGYYEGATFSKQLGSFTADRTVIYNGRSSPRMHIRRLADQLGAQVSYNSSKKEVYVTTSKFPTGAITYPEGLREGDKITFQLRGTAYSTTIDRYSFSIGGSPVKSGRPNINSFSDSVTHTLSAGQQELRLEITDSIGRTTTYRQYISPAGKPAPPPEPPKPDPPVGRPVADFTMPSMAADWDPVRIKNTSKPPKGGRLVDAEWEVSTSRYDGELGFDGGTIYFYNFNRTYDVTLTVWDNNGMSDTVTKSIFITEWVPPDYGDDPEPEPEPQLQPPWADFELPEEVYQGETVEVVNTSTDPDGEIVENKWSIDIGDRIEDVWDSLGNDEEPPLGWTLTPGMGVNGALDDAGGTIVFPEEGIYTVTLKVTDNDGLWDYRPKTIIVLPAIPKAYFSWTGTPKENRKIELDATNSFSPEVYPIDWTKTEWEIKPPEDIDANSIKIVTSTDLSKRTLLFKQAGDYKVRVRVTNAGGLTSGWYEETIKIYPDEPPVADFFVMESITRDPAEGNKAKIELNDQSYSPDGDLISKRVWKYRYDSNNDGSFDDEAWQILDDGNNPSPILYTDQVGKYEFMLEVEEEFGQETISQFITPADKKVATTAGKPLEERRTEVINIRPVVGFAMDKKPKVQITVIAGDIDQSKRNGLEGLINNLVTKPLALQSIEANVDLVDNRTEISTSAFTVSLNHETTSLVSLGDGTAWAWGGNNYGQLGDGSTTNRSTPVQVSGLTNVKAIAGGDYHSLAVKEDGTVWAWGDNDGGQLGDGSRTSSLIPVQVPNLSDVTAVAAGTFFSMALKEDGIWAWGENDYGQLGDGTREDRRRPVKVSRLTQVQAISVGHLHSMALGRTGIVWAWGDNFYGQVGRGRADQIGTTSPFNVMDNCKAIAAGGWHSLAVRTDGTVWAWGRNNYGQLGDGSLVDRSAPTQVLGLTNVKAVAGGKDHSLAVKEDGTVWAWGRNNYGQLGDGSTTNRSTPVQVSGLTNVKAIAAGSRYSMAIKEDGTVWAWGANGNGQLGDGTTATRLVPTKSIMESEWAYSYKMQDIIPDTWDSGSKKVVVMLNDKEFSYLKSQLGMGKLISKLIANEIHVMGLGTTTNRGQLQNLIAQNEGRGAFYLNGNLTTALEQVTDYILSIIQSQKIEQYAILGEEMVYTTYYSDTESDPKYQEEWVYAHDPNIFDNSLGLASYHNQPVQAPVTLFDKVGKFEVDFKVQDNPKNDHRFDEYRLWSHSPLDKLTIYVHRRPIAEFTFILTQEGTNYGILLQSNSYDSDHQYSRPDKGIVAEEWKWKEASANTWTNGKPTVLQGGKEYLVSLRVLDPEGVWSNPDVKIIAAGTNLPPVARFTVNPNPLPLGDALDHEDLSYDPNGYALTEWTWSYRKDNGSWINNGSNFPSNVYNSLGTYEIELKVKNSLNRWSEPYYQTVEVIAQNRPPVARFTVSPNPLPLDVSPTYKDESYDPDGDPIVAWEWQYQKNGGSWINGQPTGFDAPSLGIGNYNIRLRVKDQPALAQMTPLWSEWYTQALQVIAGNQPPVAMFTVSPNPVPADEPVTYNDSSYDPEGLPLAERVWQVRKPDGTVLGEYRNQLPPRIFETTGWGDDGDGVGTFIVALRVKDQSPNGISPAKWSNWYTQTLVVEEPLRIIGETEKDTYMAGQAMLLNAYTEGRAYKVEAKVWFKNKHTNTDVTELIPERFLGDPPEKEMEWRTRRYKDDPGGRDLVVIIPPDMPDGTYEVQFTAYKESTDGTIKTAHDTITVRVEGVVYDRSYSQIIGGPR